MAVKDVEVPYYRVARGSKPAITFDFTDVIPTGMTIQSHTVSSDDTDCLEHEESVLSSKSILAVLNAHRAGEAMVTVFATIGTVGPGTIEEALQARVLVEAI